MLEHIFDGLTGILPKSKEQFLEQVANFKKQRGDYTEEQLEDFAILKSQEKLDPDYPEPGWSFVSARLLRAKVIRQVTENRGFGYGNLLTALQYMEAKGRLTEDILKHYSKEDILEAQKVIDPELDDLFTYMGLYMLQERYLTKTGDHKIIELPQERWMVIALHNMMYEDPNKRMDYVKEAYWAMSNLYMTVATPTLAASGKTHGQLSSCFIDTVEDSLDGIYGNNSNTARLSKNGGGVGIYYGKVRSMGSDIKGFKGISTGVMPWLRQLNNTAVSVDQLGQRQGSVAVYLDVWHKDIFRFLDGSLNNGDERFKIHDLFTGVCIPDIFMTRLAKKQKFSLFDPHEIKQKMGFALEDYFDSERLPAGETPDPERHAFSYRYIQCENNPDLSREEVDTTQLKVRIIKVQKESGMPYEFYRDTVNRLNPNSHAGMIYCSNLCTEITQNQSPTVITKEIKVGEDKYIVEYDSGDFVVCNLSSINLGKAVKADVIERVIPIQMRMLDNVIDLNMGRIEVHQAEQTNAKYRAVGLGTYGWAHLLAQKKIDWESEESVELADQLYEKIAFHTIKASMELAKEKGTYPLFEGSDWSNGQYFAKRGYDTVEWNQLAQDVANNGVRNGYMMAVAPNASIGKIGASTDGVDPVFGIVYAEEKKRSKITTVVPDLNLSTLRYYKIGYHIDQMYSIKQNVARQRHIDQAVSFNLYLPNTATASEIIKLHFTAWKLGMKTIYYTRSTSSVIPPKCEACAG